ncbi:MAG: response regulator transcription factor [Christensenella sp.]|uniref:response regulator transcription factor n=1 Tax=Christensenella sp. TaxID=1935934 RepID=UPI002B214E64|nr:response regulator transcription factor [Christensenella sp.]MEA5002088.1 response regulator transcription factor [Christensenella sp.]
MKIIIVEDNHKIRNELMSFLQRYGYQTAGMEHFGTVVQDILHEKGDLLLLDINLPEVDGYSVCREIRKTSDIPIIIVTSRNTEMDELMSINLGADDFVTKPYNTQILLARINSVLKRVNKSVERIDCGCFALNLARSVIELGQKEIEITKNELRILNTLATHRGSIVTREELMKDLWNDNMFVDDNTLSVNVNRLRKKMEEEGLADVIETKRGQGYLLR